VLVVLALALFFVGRAWVENYLGSAAFQQLVATRIGGTLEAQTELDRLHYSAMNLQSDGLRARGSEEAAFSRMNLQQIRAELSLRRFFDRIWQVDRLEVQRLALDLDGPRVLLPAAAPVGHARSGGLLSGWMPDRVEIGSAFIRELNLDWGRPEADADSRRGHLHGVAIELAPQDGGWRIDGRGGDLIHEGFPSLDVTRLQIRYRQPMLFVQSAELRQGERGTLNITGEVQLKESLDLQVKLASVDVTPLLPPDWRARLHGSLAGDVNIRTRLPAQTPPTLSGTLRLEDGQLEALPVLDQIAVFTRMQQFRRLALSTASGDFHHDGVRLRVSNFAAESRGLLRLEGKFVVVGGAIDGDFQVGITPAALQWLPGSQERVFTVARGGYLWTPMRVTGPLDKPQEDLSGRLAVAAGSAIIETVEKTGREAIETGKDAAKGVLDLLNPLFR
jgi:hypothetical protein